MLVVARPDQLRALADEVRPRIVLLLRERARSTTELAEELGLAKGTVAYHLKTLEAAGLVKVVRTRRVRAMTERFYGRTARLFVFRAAEEGPPSHPPGALLAAAYLRELAEGGSVPPIDERTVVTLLRVRLGDEDARKFARRVERLIRDLSRAEDPAGEQYVFAGGLLPGERA